MLKRLLIDKLNIDRVVNKFRHLLIVLFLLSSNLFSQDTEKFLAYFTPELKQKFRDTYGAQPKKTLDQWLILITDNSDKDDWQKMRLVNHFFNKKIKFIDDIDHWKEEDYWATPLEFIGTQGGDCEDFALAKYFTLKAMGVAPQNMRLMYVRALAINQPHMVLIYSQKIDEMPLVLDNINPKILPANQRRDLKPIYSFNGDGLWLAKAKGLGKRVKGKGGVARWEDIVTRIEDSEFKTNK
jgi:predicted transglutaminase-like cysteine proteinase